MLPDSGGPPCYGGESRAVSRAACTTQAAQALASRLHEVETRRLPMLPESHPLWLSPERTVGVQGKHFTEWNETVVLHVTESSELAKKRRNGLICDTLTPPVPERRKPGI